MTDLTQQMMSSVSEPSMPRLSRILLRKATAAATFTPSNRNVIPQSRQFSPRTSAFFPVKVHR